MDGQMSGQRAFAQVKSATGPSFFALARFCGDWKDAGKSTRAQTDRTGIKRARFHVLVCHGGNSRLLGLDALWVADPAPSQFYTASAAPTTSSPIVMPAAKREERMAGSPRAQFWGGGMIAWPPNARRRPSPKYCDFKGQGRYSTAEPGKPVIFEVILAAK